MIVNLISGFVIGVLGSLHCMGMCGPLALSIQLPAKQSKGMAVVLYHLGKTMAYTSLGLIIGFIGLGFGLFKWQQVFSIAIGTLMLLFVLWHYVLRKGVRINMPYAQMVQNQIGTWLGKPNSMYKYPILGFLNGLLPCGLVYIALGTAGLTATLQGAASVMIGFGVGTAPALVLMMVFKQRFGKSWRLQRALPILVGLTSILMIVRGLNLGIPYLSPKLNARNNSIENCCAK